MTRIRHIVGCMTGTSIDGKFANAVDLGEVGDRDGVGDARCRHADLHARAAPVEAHHCRLGDGGVADALERPVHAAAPERALAQLVGPRVELADLLDRVGYYYEVIDHDRDLREAPPWVHVVARRGPR